MQADSRVLDFSLPATDGRVCNLEEFSGKKGVVVVFTCNHCPYAVAYEQRLIALHNEFSQDIPLLAISSNDAGKYPQDSFDLMKVRATQRGFPFAYCYDETQRVAHQYGAQRTPEVYLIDLQGGQPQVVYSGAIDDNYQYPGQVKEAYLKNAMQALIAGAPIAPTETRAVGCTIKWK